MTTFWGLICESGNRYKQKVESQFHLTMAALDPKSQKSNKLASVYVENQGTEYLICNLNGEKNLQERVDLMFAQDEEVTFFVKGEGTVHLTGYEMPEDDFGMNGDMYDDEELEDEEEEALPVVNGKRKNVEQVNAAANGNKKLKGKDAKAQVVDIDATKLDKKADKKPQQQQNNKQQQAKKPAQPAADDDDDDDILGNIDSDIDSEELDKLINQGSDDDLDEEDDFEDEDDEDDLDDDDDSEEEKLKSVQQKVKGKLNGQAAGKQAQPTPNKPQQQQQQKNAQTPKTNQQNQAKTPQTQNKNQQNQGKTPNQKNNNQNQNNQNRQQTPFVKGNNNKQQQNSNKKVTPFNSNKKNQSFGSNNKNKFVKSK